MSIRLIGLALLVLSTGCARATEPSEGTPPGRIVVTGDAEIRTAPDRARFSAAVVTEARDADSALEDNARRTERLLEALREAGIATESIQTRGVTLNPRWEHRPRDAGADWRPGVIGYQARNRLQVTTASLDRVGELLAIAVEAGANDLQGVHFSLEEDADARRRAIEQATRSARREAGILAEAAGVATGSVLELRLDHARTDLPHPSARAEEMMVTAQRGQPARNVPVEPGEVTIRASVTLTLAVEQD